MSSVPEIPGYRVAGIAGKGGYATVYRGWQVAVGREVAIKLDNRVLLEERDRRRFVREVTAAGRLAGHPHVVDVYDAGALPDGRPYLVMEYCPEGSLADAARRDGVMSPERVRDIGVRIADALGAAHAAGVLHRDVKPGNILVNRYGVVGLADFGLASLLAIGAEQSVTREAFTPAYAAPESFHGHEPTVAGDLYSLAATLYDLLAGRPPRYPADGRRPTIAMIVLNDQPVEDIPGVPAGLMGVLRQSLAVDPAERPRSAEELRDTLVAVADAGPLAAPAPAIPDGPGGLKLPARPDRVARPRATVSIHRGTLRADTARTSAAGGRRPRRARLASLIGVLVLVLGAGGYYGVRELTHSGGTAGTGTQVATHVSRVLYSFNDRTTDGWKAGANDSGVSAVSSFADNPGTPYASNYALDGAGSGADITEPITMTLTPAKPLNLSSAKVFSLYIDGYGDAPYATAYDATVTLTSGDNSRTKVVGVPANAWSHITVDLSDWSYRGDITSITVSWTGVASAQGVNTPWFAHFQIDDVGYTT